MAFAVEFSPRAREHVETLRKRDQQIILDAISVQLTHEPQQPTRNRKRLEDNQLAPWELRVGRFRVFYDIKETAKLVVIVAVGKKKQNVLQIGGEELAL